MNPIQFVPILIMTLALAFTSFTKNKNWAIIIFVAWIVIFLLTFIVGVK